MKKFSNKRDRENYINVMANSEWLTNLYKDADELFAKHGKKVEKDYKVRVAEKQKEAGEEFDAIAKLADSWKVQEKYRDYWFAWHFGDNDFWDYLETGARIIAEHFCELYEHDVWELARHKYEAQKHREDINDPIWRKRHESLLDNVIKDMEDSIKRYEDYFKDNTLKDIDESKVFWDKKYLIESISHIGCSIIGMKRSAPYRKPDGAESDYSSFGFHIKYMTEGKNLKYVAIGEKEVRALLEVPESSKDIIKDRTADLNGECIVVHIQDGEIKFCRTI